MTQFSTLLFALFFLLIGCLRGTHGKVYTRCGVAQELVRRNFPRSFIGNWVCLVESESQLDTSKVTPRADGTQNLGIFQINSRWCSYGNPGGSCSMRCEALIDENLVDDAGCAKRVYNELGFRGWNGWQRNCYGRNLQSFDVSRCK